MPAQEWEVIVAGSGPAGSTAAALLAQEGHSVLIIERSPPRSIQGLPAQGRNMDVPIQFRLVINRDECVLIDQRDRSRYTLQNTRCKPE